MQEAYVTVVVKPLERAKLSKYFHVRCYSFARWLSNKFEAGSVGLGLAIAQTIAATNGYALTYTYEKGMHVFGVKFTEN